MKQLNLLVIALIIIFSGSLLAQDMTPPAPIKSDMLSSMEGTWVSNPYQMMGQTMTDEVNQSMILNDQFFQVKVKSTSDKGFVYEGLIIMALSEDGTMTGTGYDTFGKAAITTYTGTSKDGRMYITGKSSWGEELRNTFVDGDVMINNVSFKMTGADGKEMPEQTMEITYNKR